MELLTAISKYFCSGSPKSFKYSSCAKMNNSIYYEVYTMEEVTMEIQDLYLQQPKSVTLNAHVPPCSMVRDNDTSSF